jgi:DNA-binding ferritin-like protein
MQTERVTFLTSRDHKAALDAYARESGMSVGHVVREATSTYMAQSPARNEDEEVLELVLPVLEEVLPRMQADLEAMRQSIAEANAAVDAALARVAELDAQHPMEDWKSAA